VEFIETPAFTKNLSAYLDDERYRLFQGFLMKNPETGKVIPETGGLRKVRWGDFRRGKGKRGGLRIINKEDPGLIHEEEPIDAA
jgi:mRNA-degrading endonuclease RelE of RelBE toxin-antitoxin system